MAQGNIKLSEIKACSFDTNILIRWIVQDDALQGELVEKFLNSASLKKVHLADLVVVEVIWVLGKNYELDREGLVEVIEILLNHPKFVLNRQLFQNISNDFKTKLSLSLVDLMLLEYSKLNQAEPLITFDQKLAKFGAMELK